MIWSLIQRNIYQEPLHPTWISLYSSHLALLLVAYIHLAHVLAIKATNALIRKIRHLKHSEEYVEKYFYDLKVRKNVLKTYTHTINLIKILKIYEKLTKKINTRCKLGTIYLQHNSEQKNGYKSMKERQTTQ